MKASAPVLPFALCGYSLPHVMGYLPTQAGVPNHAPITLITFAQAAHELGLAGIEVSLSRRVPSFDGTLVETVAASDKEFMETLAALGLEIVADYGALLDTEIDQLRAYLDLARSMGATVVRVLLSHVLCGDRRKIPGGWEAHLTALTARLREALPYAADRGLSLALENHQDATSADLIRLYQESGESAAFGITLDTGNPLAVGEDPVEFAQRLAPLIRHVHLKDYTLHFAPQGYRLVRCAAGDGVIDFPALLKLIRTYGPNRMPAIEIAAQATRTIPMLEPDWWSSYPPAHASYLIPVLRLLWEQGIPAETAYGSAWEHNADSITVAEEEWAMVRRSVDYFHNLASFLSEADETVRPDSVEGT